MNRGTIHHSPSLIVLTGPSHAGKTTLALELKRVLTESSEALSLDPLLTDALYPKEQAVRAAYETLFRQISRARERVVMVEATFTLVQRSGVCITFSDLYGKLLKLSRYLQRRVIATFVDIELGEALRRAEYSKRLPPALVARIWRCSQVLRDENPGLITISGDDRRSAVETLIAHLGKCDQPR